MLTDGKDYYTLCFLFSNWIRRSYVIYETNHHIPTFEATWYLWVSWIILLITKFLYLKKLDFSSFCNLCVYVTWNDTRQEMVKDDGGRSVMLSMPGGIVHKSRFQDYMSFLIHWDLMVVKVPWNLKEVIHVMTLSWCYKYYTF